MLFSKTFFPISPAFGIRSKGWNSMSFTTHVRMMKWIYFVYWQDRPTSTRGRVKSWSDFVDIGDSEHTEDRVRVSESLFDGWDFVEHPTLPPPPDSEDIEHWTRAMFIDATK